MNPGLPGPGAPALTCRDVIALVLEYLEEALDPETGAALDSHLEGCAPCRAYLRTYERSRRLVGDVARNEMPAELTARLRELLLASHRARLS